jgi:predicted Zn-ribbon and HTH transcriptional regulator
MRRKITSNDGSAATRFKRGHRASRATEFKPGTLRGYAARVWVPVGTVKVRDGYKQIKTERGWESLARQIWTKAHGAVPAGHGIYRRDGDLLNDDLKNLVCMRHSDWMKEFAKRLHSIPSIHQKIVAACHRGRETQREMRESMKSIRPAEARSIQTRWQCVGCGYDAERKPGRCPRCGASSFERIRIAGRAA